MKFIHISDLHFNPDNDGRTSRSIREGLIDYLKELNLSVEELLITGDFRHAKYQSKKQSEIDAVVKYIKDIAAAVNITDVNHIHVVPGNHDRDRIKNVHTLTKIRNKYDPQNGRFSQADLDLLLPLFEYFEMVCYTLYGPDHYWSSSSLHTYRVVNETVFVYLNTAIMHNFDKDRGRLIIGNDYLDLLLREVHKNYPEYPIIVLAHHSPDFFEKHEKEAVEDILGMYPNVILYLCGDAHEAWPRVVNGHLEATTGCLVHGKSVEPTFFYGDTATREYVSHHWAHAWEPYRAFNERISRFFPKLLPVINTNEVNGWQKRTENTKTFSLYSLKSMLTGSEDIHYSWADDLLDGKDCNGDVFPESVYQGLAWVTFENDEQFLQSVLPEELYSYLKDKIDKQPNKEEALKGILSCNYNSFWKRDVCKKILKHGTRRLLEVSRSLMSNENAFFVHQRILFRLLGEEGDRLRESYYNCNGDIRKAPYVGLAMFTVFALLGPDGFKTLLPSPTKAGDLFYSL